MVSKSKLKMALVAERGVDFKKEHQKKMAKMARKEKIVKETKNGVADPWEDVEEENESEDSDGGVSVDEEGSDDEPMPLFDVAGIDDTDSDSSNGDAHETEEDGNNIFDEEGEEEDNSEDSDIPLSDLDDLSDAEKEDMIPHQRLTINNHAALITSLKRIALPLSSMPFSEHQSLTTSAPVAASIPDVSDDLARELAFYSQCLTAVKEGRKLLKAEGAPFTRPKDYFAEMVKADEHMAKIKARLIDAAAGKKAAADARKQRDLKKFGKQVQVQKVQERQKEKTMTLERIKSLKRKRQGVDVASTNEADMFDVALDQELPNPDSSRRERRDKAAGGMNNKRQKKDAKFGFGGKKRFSKSGDAASSGDLRGFSAGKMKGRSARGGGRGGGGGGGGAARGGAKRLGKARRAASGRR